MDSEQTLQPQKGEYCRRCSSSRECWESNKCSHRTIYSCIHCGRQGETPVASGPHEWPHSCPLCNGPVNSAGMELLFSGLAATGACEVKS